MHKKQVEINFSDLNYTVKLRACKEYTAPKRPIPLYDCGYFGLLIVAIIHFW